MANTIIQFKKNNTTGQTPTLGELSNGEIGINFHDGVIFFKNDANTFVFSVNSNVKSSLTVGDGFNTWNVDNVLVSYTPSNGVFNIFPTNTVTEQGNSSTDIISLGDLESLTNVASTLVIRNAGGNIAVGNITAVGAVFNNNVGINTGTPVYQLDVSGGLINATSEQIQAQGSIGSSWLSPSDSFKNILINGSFEIWQRGASGVTPVSDRWSLTTANGTGTTTVKQQAGLTNQSQFSVVLNSIHSATIFYEQPLTLDMIYPLLQQNLAIQFAMNLSNGSGAIPSSVSANIYVGTGTAKKKAAVAYTNELLIASLSANTSCTGVQIVTGTSNQIVPANTTQMTLMFSWTTSLSGTTNTNIAIDDVQIEIGPQATEYNRRSFPLELLLCKRFYQKSVPYSVDPTLPTYLGAVLAAAPSASNIFCSTVFFSPVMYQIPTIVVRSPGGQVTNKWSSVIPGDNTGDRPGANLHTIGDSSMTIRGTANTTLAAGGEIYGITWTADAEI